MFCLFSFTKRVETKTRCDISTPQHFSESCDTYPWIAFFPTNHRPLNFQLFFQFTMIIGERNLQFDAVLRPGSFRGNRHVSIDGDGNQMTHLKTWSLRGSQILKILELDHCSFAGFWLFQGIFPMSKMKMRQQASKAIASQLWQTSTQTEKKQRKRGSKRARII